MQLILAIDSDPRRSEQLANLVRARLTVDLVQATSAGEGLHALRDRVPDLILTSPLLSPFDDGVLDEYLRDLGAAATHVQTVRIPMLSTAPRKKSAATRLFSLGRKKKQTSSAAPDGCDPKLFADEITHYLTRSLEERAALAKSGSPSAPRETQQSEFEAAPAADQWGITEALIEEFRAPAYAPPAPTAAARSFVEDMHVEDMHVPGSILDLRAPITHAPAPEPRVVVEPEPQAYVELASELYVEPVTEVYVEPEPPAYIVPEPLAYVEPVMQAYSEPARPAFVEPKQAAPIFVEPERAAPIFVASERAALVEPELPVIVAPVTPVAAVSVLKAVNPPAAPATETGTSASFEAALAAIRAAWAKPEPKAAQPTTAEPKTTAPATPVGGAKPLAGSGEVDLTNEIDALEDVTGVNGSGPAADDNDSPDGSIAPTERRKAEKPRKRQEQPRGSKTRGADGRDDWGVFDPNQCGFSTLVNKLDEVTEDDVVTARATTIVR